MSICILWTMIFFPVLQLTFQIGKTASFQIDFCSIAPCGSSGQDKWRLSEKYVCVTRPRYKTDLNSSFSLSECSSWSDVFANTGDQDWGYNPWEAQEHDLKTRFSIIKSRFTPIHECKVETCNPLIITIKDCSYHDKGTYILGAYVSGTDLLGKFIIQVTETQPALISPSSNIPATPPPDDLPSQPIIPLNITTLSSTFSIETGYGDQNRWLQWVLYSARQINQSDCYACATARPHLATTPFPLTDPSEPTGLPCLLYIFTTAFPPTDPKCHTLNTLFPPIQPITPPMFRPYIGNYTCFTRAAPKKNAVFLASFANFSLHGPGVYIDSIGVPRGVPNKFKAGDQVAAGFESLFPIITINKNVDWINYLYYNQQRFLNFTKEAVEGIHEQLDKTSLMTWQNRGVCAMFGDACCTYIPNNTALDGSITRALAGLTALSLELAENSGIDTPLDEWFISTFGSWGQWFKSIFVSLLVALTVILFICCCGIPLIRYFIQKFFTASITKAYFLHTERMHLLPQCKEIKRILLI
uniref:Uncharacterized protein n=1 Tax=Erpetoichthys calabaricus TaxID=27687 RepID=A0A8C4SGI9_ERPCA